MEAFLIWVSSLKLTTLLPALGGAIIAVLLEIKRHTFASGLIAILSGVFVAGVATGPIVHALGWGPETGGAIGGVLGISGRNLIFWVLQISKDPAKAWKNRK